MTRTIRASRGFQVFAKPAGPACNLACRYCYYLEKSGLFQDSGVLRMPDDLLEDYIVQHLQASPDEVIRFSWHGGEPTLAGLDFFRKAVALQKKYRPDNRQVANGLQTNGLLLNDEWGRFFGRGRIFRRVEPGWAARAPRSQPENGGRRAVLRFGDAGL